MAEACGEWREKQSGATPRTVIFIDEAETETNVTRSPGRAPCGKRLVDAVPHGHWRTEAFIGTLRCDGLDRYCSFEAAINGEIFPVDNEQIIVPKLRSCDILTADNLSSQPACVRRSKVGASLLSFAPTFGTSIFAWLRSQPG